eukprot:gnl/TRDRNA2_/TRDRNA2_165616_c0_seq1.p1 gnl/TRDRNA2_/TRDRNA2_165616_c0~~gnl/TRDRNA2_/TRDRNA2_165616_c0_seq1.p1  ORF type:complete len:311 (+),score=13.47 gnl/TRDRNA2_/TRDRNA2_165616_c0_seq1:55-987(+)
MGKGKKRTWTDIDDWTPVVLEELGRQLQEISIIKVSRFTRFEFVKQAGVGQASYTFLKQHFGFVSMLRSRPDLFSLFGVPDDSVSERQLWLRSPDIPAVQNRTAAACKLFMHNYCREGRSCRFRHDPADCLEHKESISGSSVSSSSTKRPCTTLAIQGESAAELDVPAITAVLKAAPDHTVHYQVLCSRLQLRKKMLLRIVEEHPEVFETLSSKKYPLAYVRLRTDACLTTTSKNHWECAHDTVNDDCSENHGEFEDDMEASFIHSRLNDAKTANEAHWSMSGVQSNHTPHLAKRSRPSQAPHLLIHPSV